jgi:hypothetical protein
MPTAHIRYAIVRPFPCPSAEFAAGDRQASISVAVMGDSADTSKRKQLGYHKLQKIFACFSGCNPNIVRIARAAVIPAIIDSAAGRGIYA